MTNTAVSIDADVLVATHRVAVFDRLRVPYAVLGAKPQTPRGAATLVVVAPSDAGDGPTLRFPRGIDPGTARAGAFVFGRLPVYSSILTDDAAQALLRDPGRVGNRELPVCDAAGRSVGSSWSSADGSIFLPFDPDHAVHSLESKRYQTYAGRNQRRTVQRVAKTASYAARPMMPRRVQLGLRRALRHIQGRSRFPRYPFDAATLDLDELVVLLAASRRAAAADDCTMARAARVGAGPDPRRRDPDRP